MVQTQVIDCNFVYEICRKHFENFNIILKFPKNTPPHLTYQWRFIKILTNKFVKWNFTIEEIDLFINIAIKKRYVQLKTRGLSVLNDSDIVDECYTEVKNHENVENQDIVLLKNTHQWLIKQLKNDSAVEHLINRRKPGSFTNITTYYQSGYLVKLYIAFSKSCCAALELLSQRCPEEREKCPSTSALYFIRHYQNQSILPQIKEILGSDSYV